MVECMLIGKGGRVMNNEVTCYEDDDQIDCSELQEDYSIDEGEIIAEILCAAAELGGTVERTNTLNSVGRSSKKIIIEYDVQNRR